MRRSLLKRQLLLGFVGMYYLLVTAGTAQAHAVLVHSEPAEGQILAESPQVIILTFSESVTPVVVRLIDANGGIVASLKQETQKNATVSLPLGAQIGNGQYLVSYRVMSADTHAISGGFHFGVGQTDSSSVMQMKDRAQESILPIVVGNRFLQFASLATAAGLTFFFVVVKPPGRIHNRLFVLTTCAASVAVATYVLAIGAGAADTAGVGLRDLIDLSVWRLGARTSLATSAAVGALGALVLIIGWWSPDSRPRSILLLAGAATTLAGLAVTGHAATASPQWLSGPAVAVHLIAAAFWIAAMLPLAWILTTSPASESERVLKRFSTWAVLSVVLLLATGGYLAIVQVRSFSALLSTNYGLILLLKLGLVTLLLALAAFNKYVLTPQVNENGPTGRVVRKLCHSIYVELSLMTGILILTTILTTSVPPRSIAASVLEDVNRVSTEQYDLLATDFKVSLTRQGYIANIVVSPAMTGRGMLRVSITTDAQERVVPTAVFANWSLPELDVNIDEQQLERTSEGRYVAELRHIVVAGTWQLTIDVLVDDFTKISYQAEVAIAEGKE